MSLLSWKMDIRKSILEILATLPRNQENRLTMLRLLWQIAVGPIITGHAVIQACAPRGKLVVQVDDRRWIKEIQRVSEIILDRMNQMLLDLKCPEYTLCTLIMTPSYQKKIDVEKAKDHDLPTIPTEIIDSSSDMDEDLQKAFLEWYRTVNSKN